MVDAIAGAAIDGDELVMRGGEQDEHYDCTDHRGVGAAVRRRGLVLPGPEMTRKAEKASGEPLRVSSCVAGVAAVDGGRSSRAWSGWTCVLVRKRFGA